MSRYTFPLESSPSLSATSSSPSSPSSPFSPQEHSLSPIEIAHNKSQPTIAASYFNPDDFWVCCCRAQKERKLSCGAMNNLMSQTCNKCVHEKCTTCQEWKKMV